MRSSYLALLKLVILFQGLVSQAEALSCEMIFSPKTKLFRSSQHFLLFHEIKPGKFTIGRFGYRQEAEITRPFEMMTTRITQKMWARLKILMGEKNLDNINPSYFKTGKDSKVVNIGGIDVQMKPDHPVERVSWADAMLLINDLNRLSRLGDSKVQGFLSLLMPGHQTGDVYDLPTAAQLEFVQRDRGNVAYDNMNCYNSDLRSYAWFKQNSEGQTHPEESLLPRMIDTGGNGDRHAFYLEGNVMEWTRDWYYHSNVYMGGKDPQSIGDENAPRMTIGFSWDCSSYHNANFPVILNRGAQAASLRREDIGFRLVRTRNAFYNWANFFYNMSPAQNYPSR